MNPWHTTPRGRLVRLMAAAASLWLLGCAGRPSADESDGFSGGGQVVTADGAGASDAPPNGARSFYYGASMLPPHRCVRASAALPAAAAPAEASGNASVGFQLTPLRCRWSGEATTAPLSAPAGAVVPTDTSEDAVRQAIAKAGVGGVVAFQGGKTYLICGPLHPLRGQRWTRTGAGVARLKRCANKGGAPVIAVGADDVSLDHLTIDGNRSENPGKSGDSLPPLVDASPSWRAATATAGGAGAAGTTAGGDVRRLRVEACELRAATGDLLRLERCASCAVRDSRLTETTGAALALVGTSALLGRGLRVSAVGSAVRWGGGNLQPRVERSCIADVSGVAFGTLAQGDRGVHLAANTLLRVGGVLTVPPAAELAPNTTGGAAGDDVPLDLSLRDHFGVDVGGLRVGVDASAAGPRLIGVRVSGNRWLGGFVQVRGCRDVQLHHNTLTDLTMASPPQVSASPARPAASDGLPPALVQLRDVSAVALSNNLLLGGPRGLALLPPLGGAAHGASAGASSAEAVLIENNMLLGQTGPALTVGDAAGMLAAASAGAAGGGTAAPRAAVAGVVLNDNTVVPNVAAPPKTSTGSATPAQQQAAAWAALLGHGVHLLGSCVSGRGVLLDSLSASQAAAAPPPTVVLRNTVRGEPRSLAAVGGGGGLFIQQNALVGSVGEQIRSSPFSTVSANFASKVPCAICWPAADLWQHVPTNAPVEVQP